MFSNPKIQSHMGCGASTEILKILQHSASAGYKDILFKNSCPERTIHIQYRVKPDYEFPFSIAWTTKTSKQIKKVPDITLHLFPEEESLCPYKTWEHYLEVTRSWLIKGLDISVFKTYSARSANTSIAKSVGLSTKDILRRENWTRKANLQKYYCKEIVLSSKQF